MWHIMWRCVALSRPHLNPSTPTTTAATSQRDNVTRYERRPHRQTLGRRMRPIVGQWMGRVNVVHLRCTSNGVQWISQEMANEGLRSRRTQRTQRRQRHAHISCFAVHCACVYVLRRVLEFERKLKRSLICNKAAAKYPNNQAVIKHTLQHLPSKVFAQKFAQPACAAHSPSTSINQTHIKHTTDAAEIFSKK